MVYTTRFLKYFWAINIIMHESVKDVTLGKFYISIT